MEPAEGVLLPAPEDELDGVDESEDDDPEVELEPALDLSLGELGEALLLDELGELLMLPEPLLLPGVDAEPDIELDDDGELLGVVLEPEDDEGLEGLVEDEEDAPVDDFGVPVRSHP